MDCSHMCVVVHTHRLRDLFRKRLWVRCWQCDLKEGPFKAKPVALLVGQSLEPQGWRA